LKSSPTRGSKNLQVSYPAATFKGREHACVTHAFAHDALNRSNDFDCCEGNMPENISNVEEAVRQRYADGAKSVEPGLCCPATYDPQLLAAIPQEVLDRDYGCGDPTRHLHPGDAVLDLGSGSGKICFLASQVVGPTGRVVGVDMNGEMLTVARRNAPEVARKIGYANVEFRKGKIQDLALDLEVLDGWLSARPVRSTADIGALEAAMNDIRRSRPLIADNSIDVVVSNCVLNLVRSQDKKQLFAEIFRVLRCGGRAVISDIVSDEDVPQHLQQDPELWSGCISGAFREDLFLQAFEEAGFYGVSILERQDEPWRTVEGIEFRSMTVAAYKGKKGPCWDQKHAVIYRGPFRQVEDDDGHVIKRGVPSAVCEKTYRIYSQEPYRSQFALVPPRVEVPLEEARPFPCAHGYLRRDPKETKGARYRVTTEAQGSACVSSNGHGICC
jgi:arsenite methyltransferase